jgi:methylmalonyl-CoA mutase N-terminal domain/subunit
MEQRANEYIEKIDKMGGIVKAVEEGYPQREIARSAYEFQRQVDAGDRTIVGVNRYQMETEGDPIPTLKIDRGPEEQQIAGIQRLRAERDAAAAERCLAAVRAACRDDGANLMPPILEAVRSRVTLGEICEIFRDEFGVHTDPAYL